MSRYGKLWSQLAALVAATAGFAAAPSGLRAESLAMRIDSLVVTPAHGPSASVWIQNLGEQPYAGTVSLEVPESWIVQPAEQPVRLAPGKVGHLRFLIKSGVNHADNAYPMAVTATSASETIRRAQTVAAASAPFFKPEIDGRVEDWADAIPVSWLTGGKRTVISTYWNRRHFCLLIAVEEDRWIPRGAGRAAFDAVQLAISAEDSRTGSEPDAPAARFEFLLAGAQEGGTPSCFRLAAPHTRLADTQVPQPLDDRAYDEAHAVVWHEAGTTYYECALPWSAMRDEIPPGEGREFRLSLLVHDPDGTGLRDWGEAYGLWPGQRNRLAWSDWPGAQWPNAPPFDNKTAWGMCSSKY